MVPFIITVISGATKSYNAETGSIQKCQRKPL